MIQLQDFVKETIVQIVNGVKAAQEARRGTKARVNPRGLTYPTTADNKQGRRWDFGTAQYAEDIEFDVAVAAAEGTETKGGVGVVAAIFALGAQGKSDASSSTVSRIKFTVPVFLPESL